MLHELPKESKTARGFLRYSTMDGGARYVVFHVEPEDLETAREGAVVGMIVPAEVDQHHLDQVLGQIRELGGVRFVVVPRRPTE
jgi:hypothetical protein